MKALLVGLLMIGSLSALASERAISSASLDIQNGSLSIHVYGQDAITIAASLAQYEGATVRHDEMTLVVKSRTTTCVSILGSSCSGDAVKDCSCTITP